MGKKLLALAIVGVAAYLFKTKHGAEIRSNICKAAGEWKDKITDLYSEQAGNVADAIKQTT